MGAYTELFDLIGVLARRRYQAGERGFAALGLNHTEARLLKLLGQAGGAAPQDLLAAGLYVDRSNAGRALKRLEAEGYIERHKAGADRRCNTAQLTARGQAAVEQITALRTELAQSFCGALTAAEAAQAVGLLGKVVGDERR